MGIIFIALLTALIEATDLSVVKSFLQDENEQDIPSPPRAVVEKVITIISEECNRQKRTLLTRHVQMNSYMLVPMFNNFVANSSMRIKNICNLQNAARVHLASIGQQLANCMNDMIQTSYHPSLDLNRLAHGGNNLIEWFGNEMTTYATFEVRSASATSLSSYVDC